MAKMEGRKQFS